MATRHENASHSVEAMVLNAITDRLELSIELIASAGAADRLIEIQRLADQVSALAIAGHVMLTDPRVK